jgi:hypothetical protein
MENKLSAGVIIIIIIVNECLDDAKRYFAPAL